MLDFRPMSNLLKIRKFVLKSCSDLHSMYLNKVFFGFATPSKRGKGKQ